ncbi:MAG: 3' terminal RNA ribose 2'-O-methyltransferase Hen1 [Solirubrobacteraceae bacterium]|nr:3' terminal RNA ribose 2'-O-methyltransferase Hen1 [Solirubrobacteraceae bacterium]
MLLTLTLTGPGATDLGYLLHKHPDRVQEFSLPFGKAQVFYPEAEPERCTAALMLEIDPVGLVRRGAGGGFALAEYVNDRPYVASSFLAVGIVSVFKSALAGNCKPRPELAATALPFEVEVPVVPARGGADLVRRLLEPLGYAVDATPIPLDPQYPEWGNSRYVALKLAGTVRLAELLSHLYVLLPVLDDEKHYWVDDTEIEKLMRRGEGWLPDHPERELIVKRYLKHQASLYAPATAQLQALDAEGADDDAVDESTADGVEAAEANLEGSVLLRDQRLDAVEAAVKASGARRVLDLGCGPGALLRRLIRGGYESVVGVDVSIRALELAARRLKLDLLPDEQRARITLLHGALTYRDERLAGYDAAVLQEVIEHLDEPRLAVAEQNVFGTARPGTVIVTTPNAEYNVMWPSLPAGAFRHRDHRFEWTREEFQAWGARVCERHGYRVDYRPIGPLDETVGSPTQMAVFTR